MDDDPVLQPDDHHLLRFYAAINRVVQPAMHRVFILLRPDNGKSVKELLFDISEFSQTKYKKNFTEPERQKLDEGKPSSEFDISLLYKLLQRVCGLADANHSKWSDVGSLENSLRRLKDYRNTLAHEQISLTSDELREKIRDMEGLSQNILEAAGQQRSLPVAADLERMHDGMEEAISGEIDLWEPYKTALAKLRSEHTTVLIREGRKDIHAIGKNLMILNPFVWMIDSKYANFNVESVYTENGIKGMGNVDIQHLLVSAVPEHQPDALPDVIVISATPGMGKTSSFRFLVQDWLSSNPTTLGMENIDLIVPVVLRHVSSNNIKDLVKDELLHNVAKHLQPDDIISALKNVSLLWMLDGYDEASTETRKVVKEIVQKFPGSRIMITTREEFKNEIETEVASVGRSYSSVTLAGFSVENIQEYAKKIISASVQDPQKRSDILKEFMDFTENGYILHILRVPLFAAITIVLWLDSPENASHIKTTSSLFTLLVDHMIQRLLLRESYRKLNQTISSLKQKLSSFFDSIGFVLWRNYDHFILQQYEVDYLLEKCSELGLPFKDSMSAFFVYAEKATPLGIVEDYTIIHRQLMEFLGARAFANKMIHEGWDVMDTAKYFLQSKRELLLKHESSHYSLGDLYYNIDNLSMELPCDKYGTFGDNGFVMPVSAFIIKESWCSICFPFMNEKLSEDYYLHTDGIFTTRKSRNFWCHVKDKLSGLWFAYVLGCLSLSRQLNEERCEQFSFIFGSSTHPFLKIDYILLGLNEAGDDLFVKKLCNYVNRKMWAFEYTPFVSHTLTVKLLQYIQPKSVFLHLCKKLDSQGPDGVTIPNKFDPTRFLLDCIETFVEYHCEIHLDMRLLFQNAVPDLELTMTSLERLLRGTSRCRLVTFRGVVDDSALVLLKRSTYLRELSLMYIGEDLRHMAELVKTLPELNVFRLAMDFRCCSGEELPVLIRDEEVAVPELCVILTDVFNYDPERVATALKRLLPNPFHVILRGRTTTFDLEWLLRNPFPVISRGSISTFDQAFRPLRKKMWTYITRVLENVLNVNILQVLLEVPDEFFQCFDIIRPYVEDLERFSNQRFPSTTIEVKFVDTTGRVWGFTETGLTAH
ncbi:uncharacterized protein LOC135215146 [Macrobrachium nipponense]|uniref:uncharacterized protein LOC135215146 n=1 Tax=Macrobrachium nipponense TaxID=159736 RepID=UPI0030C81ADA